MRWTVHGHRDVYASEWVRVSLDDVKIPLKPPYKVPNSYCPNDSAGVACPVGLIKAG
jgi:hypothetical protein